MTRTREPRRYRSGAAWAAPLLALAISCGPELKDTGYTGTWSRGSDHVRSTIAIAERDGQYLFRWGKETADGRLKVQCDWAGDCVELADGQEVARYNFRAWIDEVSGRLRIECRGMLHKVPEPEVVHYIDEAELRKGGTKLVVFTIERSGQQFTGRGRPKFSFTKVSDTVTDPPRSDS